MSNPQSNDKPREPGVTRQRRRVALRITGVIALLLLLGIGGLRVLLVNLDKFIPQTQSWLSETLGQPVTIGAIESYWQGWMLMMRFTNISVLDSSTGKPMLELHRSRFELDIWDTVVSGKPSPGKLTISGARLAVTRHADGSFAVKGLDQEKTTTLNESTPSTDKGDLVHWVLSQGKLDLEDATLIWDDQRAARSPVQLTAVNLQLRVSNSMYQLSGSAQLPAEFGDRLSFRIEVDGDPFGRRWSGNAKFAIPNLFIASLPRRDNPSRKLAGSTGLDITTSWRGGSMASASGEFVLRQVQLVKGSNLTQVDNGRLTFDAQRLERGWRIDVGLHDIHTPNGSWPATTANIEMQTSAEGATSVTAEMEFLKIEDVAPLILAYAPKQLSQRLEGLNPRGELTGIQVSMVTDAPRVITLDLKAHVLDASVSSRGHLPGVSGLSGALAMTLDNGRLELDSKTVSIAIPGMFAEPLAISAEGTVDWVRYGTGWWFDTNGISFRHDAFEATASGTLHWPFQNRLPIVDVALRMARAELGRLSEYLPVGLIRPRLANWLLRSVIKGQLTDAELHYKGYAGDFPFNGAKEGFSAAGSVSDAELLYSKRWPRLEGLDASFEVTGRQLLIKPNAVTVKSGRMLTGSANISDLSAPVPVLNVETTFGASMAAGLEYLQQGSLKDKFGTFASGIQADGPIEIALSLSIPIPVGERKIAGIVRLHDNDMSFTRFKTRIEQANGQIEFSRTGVTSSGIKGEYLGAPIEVTAIRHPRDLGFTRLRFQGKADKEFLVRQLHALNLFADPADPPRIMSRIHGSTPWKMQLDLPPDWGQPNSKAELTVKTNLRGLTFDLPAPFNKAKGAAKPLSIRITLSDAQRRVVAIRYADDIGGIFELHAAPNGFELNRGAVVFGDSRPELPDNRGLHVGGQLEQFSIDSWSEVTRSSQPAVVTPKELHDYPLLRVLEEVEVRAKSIEFLGQQFNRTHLTVKRDKDRGWQARIKGETIAGRIFFPAPALEQLPIEVQLDSLVISEKEEQETAPGDPGRLPPIKFTCRQLTYDGIDIGTVKLATAPTEDGLSIDSFIVLGAGYEAVSAGTWRFQNDEHVTRLVTQINADTLDALLSVLGYKGESHGAATRVDLDLSWNDAPSRFSLAGAEGTLKLRANRGRLLDVNLGATGRLFGSLLFTALPRRLTLDFSDVFGEGIEFNFIEGSFALSRGHAYTNSLLLDSESARIDIAGRTGLVKEDYDQIVTITPKLSSSLPLAPLWLLQKVFKKNLFDKAFAYRYTITGSWEDPQIERVVVETSTSRED